MQTQNPFPSRPHISGYQDLSGTCSDSDTLHLFSGNLMRQVSLANLPALGKPLAFSLFYNSLQAATGGPVGYGWRHNLMAHLEVDVALVTFTEASGSTYDFEWTGSAWALMASAQFVPMALTNPSGDTWRLTFYPGGDYLEFENAVLAGVPSTKGRLTVAGDAHGNELTLSYNGTTGHLESLTDQASRALSFAFTGSLLTQVTDPNGMAHLLGYDEDDNLTSIIGPEGCGLTYGYEDPEDHLVTSRTDAKNYTYSYTFDETGRLETVTDAETPGNTLTYSYDTVEEHLGTGIGQEELARTTLLDARAATWEYRFTQAGQFWRIIDPLGHQSRFYWSPEGGLLYETAPFAFPSEGEEEEDPTLFGPRDNPNNRFYRQVRDEFGNLLQDIDGLGLVTAYTYDENHNLRSYSPGQATLGIQGKWRDVVGHDGHILCAYFDESNDIVRLPDYISSLANGDGSSDNPFSRYVPAAHSWERNVALMDSRVPDLRQADGQDSDVRSLGYWRHSESNSEFSFRLNLSETRAFNLSLYTHSSDMLYGNEVYTATPQPDFPLRYAEQFGRELELVIDDLDPETDDPRQQVFHVTNNAPGVWVTFPVYSTDESPIMVTVRGLGESKPMLSMLAFDPLESRTTTYTYDEDQALTQVRDPLGHVTEFSYNPDGTLEEQTDALARVTAFFYEDAAKNLTRIVDAALGETTLAYDDNGNLLTLEDPDEKSQTMTYDGKNRLLSFRDGEGHRTELEYDANGNLVKVTDAAGRATEMFYTPTNRLMTILDALGQEVSFEYDGSGALTKVTDARSHETLMEYDAAGRLVRVEQPDGEEVRFNLDGLNRVVAVTSPNGNQSTLSDINLVGAVNHLRNPGAEETLPSDAARPRHWVRSTGSQARSLATAHTGSASLPLEPTDSTSPYWAQKKVPSLAGARYLMRGSARKSADSVEATLTMQARVRDFEAAVASINGSPLTLDGSSADWEPIPASRLDLPGDSQFAASQPPLDELRVVAEAEDDTQVWVDDLELLRLSTAYLHDTEGLREVRLPDGTRMRMERDRYGRVNRWVDPLGRTTVVRYDSLNRVVAVVDPLGQVTSYAYDEVSNLVSFTDARESETTYLYDDLNRLLRITYPDANYEEFSYTPAGDLASYTNARGQERVFAYDLAHRLESIEFQTDMSTLEFSYDEVGNLIAQTERNGDQVFYSYDSLNRLIDVLRVPGVGSDTPGWSHAHQYDENGNRVAFSTDGPAYGSAVYGTSLYGITEATGARYDDGTYDDGTYASHPLGWSVPSPGYDEMNRLPVFADPRGREVSFSFDADGRRTEINYPNGVDLRTGARYDIVGRLLSLTTTDAATELLKLEYGYSPASERIAMRHNDDTWEYRLDNLGRLVEEAVNRMVDRTADQFAQGEFDLVELDVETDRIRLLAFSDTLANGLWNTDRWRVAVAGPESETGVPHYALGLRAFQDQGLQLTFPRGGTNLVIYADPPVHDKYGVDPALNYESDAILVAAEHRRKLHGDFDIKVEFSDLQFAMHRNNSGCHVKLAVSTQPWGMASTYGASFGRRARSLSPGAGGGYDLYYFQRSPSSAGSTSTSDAAGKFRLRREGTTMYAYYWDSSEDEWVQMGDVAYGISTEDLYVSLVMEDGAAVTSVRYTLFGHTDEETPDYPRIGTFVSSVMDAQREVTWGSLRWDEDLPSDTDVEFQVAVSDSPDGPFEFVGPNGHWSTRFSTAAGEALPTLVGRYLRYKVFLHSFDGVSSPAVSNVQISFSGLQPSSVTTYAYDPAGNRTRKTVETDDGVILDEVLDDEGWAPEDRINTLNQMMRRDVTDSGGTVSWAFTWDEDGNLTSKTDGTNTWTYTWNEDNRLVRVEGPGGVDVAFEYDAMGRMLRRSSGSDETMFEWDGWNVARETSTNGNVTRYFCLRGELLRFQRGNDFYSVHSDALGSVRIITDAAGRVVSEFGYGAFGEMLETSFDGVPGSFRYVFVGVLGCRTDETGLIFMRNRWYDPTFGRFVSRDPRGIMGTANLYSYVRSQPIGATDPLGLDTSVCAVYSETQATLKYHMDVLILDDKRRLAVRFSFGPSKPPGSKTNPLSAEPFGKLVGKRVPVPYEAALSLDPLEGKYMNLPYPVTVFADEDMTFDQIDQTLSAELGLINQKGFPYVPLGTNSNAAARTLLHALGLFDIPGPCGSGESAPGLWDLFR